MPMPYYYENNNPVKEEDIDFNDIMNVMNLLDNFAASEEGRLRLRMSEDPNAHTEKVYHHGRCDVGSPWAKGTPFDVLGCE
jgi:hypothetical protein